MVEVLDRVLPVEDEEISAFAAKAFTKQGMKLQTGPWSAESAAATSHRDPRRAARRAITVERVILAIGIVGNVEDIGLEAPRSRSTAGHIVVDQWLRTGEHGV